MSWCLAYAGVKILYRCHPRYDSSVLWIILYVSGNEAFGSALDTGRRAGDRRAAY